MLLDKLNHFVNSFSIFMNRVILFVVGLLLITFESSAQSRKYSNEFLNIGVGARALGMSGAFSARANDVTAAYWNPAALTQMEDNFQLGLMHAEYFAGLAKYDYGAFASRIDEKSVFGLSFMRFGVDDIPNTTKLIDNNGNVDFDRVTKFTAADYAFFVSYARTTNIEGLSLGGNVKIIYRNVGDFANAYGFGIDASALYKRGNWLFSAVGKDITSTFNAWSYSLDKETEKVFKATGNELPVNGLELTLPKLVLGSGRLFSIGDKFTFFPELDLEIYFDGKRNAVISSNLVTIDPKFGMEFSYNQIIFLRAGVGNFQSSEDVFGNSKTTFQPNFGLGMKLKGFSLDYALTDIGDRSEAIYSNVFSIRIDLNKKDL